MNIATPNYSAMYETSLKSKAAIARVKKAEKAKHPRPFEFGGSSSNQIMKGIFRLVKKPK